MILFLYFFSIALVLLFFKLSRPPDLSCSYFQPCLCFRRLIQFYLAVLICSGFSSCPTFGILSFVFFFHFKYAFFPFSSLVPTSSLSFFQMKFFFCLSQTLYFLRALGFSSPILASSSLFLILGKLSNSVF